MLKFADNVNFYWNFSVYQRDQSLHIKETMLLSAASYDHRVKGFENPLKV